MREQAEKKTEKLKNKVIQKIQDPKKGKGEEGRVDGESAERSIGSAATEAAKTDLPTAPLLVWAQCGASTALRTLH